MADSDDDMQLSAETMAVLKEFMAEQQTKQQSFSEDWQMSQFWYDDNTSETIINELLEHTPQGGKIACVSTPTIFRAIKTRDPTTVQYYVFEYDKRFSAFEEQFVFYDYNTPLAVPDNMKAAFDFIVFDPPYLSEECLEKVIQTIQHIAKPTCKLILMTGKVQHPVIEKLMPSLHLCAFQPRHAKGLSNEFACFCNYESPRLGIEK